MDPSAVLSFSAGSGPGEAGVDMTIGREKLLNWLGSMYGAGSKGGDGRLSICVPQLMTCLAGERFLLSSLSKPGTNLFKFLSSSLNKEFSQDEIASVIWGLTVVPVGPQLHSDSFVKPGISDKHSSTSVSDI